MKEVKITGGSSTELNHDWNTEILLSKILEFFCFEHTNEITEDEYESIKDIPHLIIRYNRIVAALKAFELYNKDKPLSSFIMGEFITQLNEEEAKDILANTCGEILRLVPQHEEKIFDAIVKGKHQHKGNGFIRTLQELFRDLWKYRLFVEKLRRIKGTGIIESSGGYYIGTLYLLEFSNKELLPLIEKLNKIILPILNKGNFVISEQELITKFDYPKTTDAELMEITANYQINQKQ